MTPPPAAAPPAKAAATTAGHDLAGLSLPGWSADKAVRFSKEQLLRAGVDADMLSEFGCRSLLRRSFQRGQRRIIAEIFEFDNEPGAYAAYSLLRKGSTTVVNRGDASSEDDASISFLKANYFVRIYGTAEDDDEMKGAIKVVADALVGDIKGRAPLPLVISTLPSIDRVRGTEKLVMGPLSMRRFFIAPYLDSLPLEHKTSAAVADYKYMEPYRERLRLLVVNYDSEQAAYRAYSGYADQLQTEHKRLTDDQKSDSVSIFKVSGQFLLVKVSGPRVMVVSGARKKDSATMLAASAY